MPRSWDLTSFNHINQIVPSYQQAVDHYQLVFGAQFLWKTTANPYIEACLMNFGGAIFEFVAPRLQDQGASEWHERRVLLVVGGSRALHRRLPLARWSLRRSRVPGRKP